MSAAAVSSALPRVLVVDDEEMVTRSLSAFLDLDGEYEVITSNCPVRALDSYAAGGADVVISDFLMPGMDGLDFLTRLREIDPEVPRILLTGYADKETAIKAINQAGLYYYLEKPWDNDDLRLVLRNAVERRCLLDCLRRKLAKLVDVQGGIKRFQSDILRSFA